MKFKKAKILQSQEHTSCHGQLSQEWVAVRY